MVSCARAVSGPHACRGSSPPSPEYTVTVRRTFLTVTVLAAFCVYAILTP